MGTSYETAVGEQRTLILSDGTKVTLNTNSALTVHYTNTERRTHLERGEAMFEVARNPRRPFFVQAAGEQVRVLGTTFIVRLDPVAGRLDPWPKVAVTLIEGRVEVESHSGSDVPQVSVLKPGQRATLRESVPLAMKQRSASHWTVDEPKLLAVAAWRRGDVVFDDVSLGEAVAELRRYGGPEVKFSDPSISDLRVSGVFGLHDITESLRAMAELHHLELADSDDGVVLER
jgi:transmembrane sensor